MRMMQWLSRAWDRIRGLFRRDLRLVDLHSDEVPEQIARGKLLRMIDVGEPWAVAMSCPCGCGEIVELSLSKVSKPHWTLRLDQGKPTLSPSVWRNIGCKSHFWVRRGQVDWVP